MQHPQQFKIPLWFLNRRKDFTTGQNKQLIGNQLVAQLREDLQRLKKIRYDAPFLGLFDLFSFILSVFLWSIFHSLVSSHRGLRHHWHLRVRGQHTKTTGRSGRTVGVSLKKK